MFENFKLFLKVVGGFSFAFYAPSTMSSTQRVTPTCLSAIVVDGVFNWVEKFRAPDGNTLITEPELCCGRNLEAYNRRIDCLESALALNCRYVVLLYS